MKMTRTADSDLPDDSGALAALQLKLGRVAVTLRNFVRPRLSLGVRLLALDASGRRVFLVRHSYLPGLYLPGGGVDTGETCLEAAIREAREEGGLVLPETPELFHVYFNPALARRDHVVLYVARGARQARGRSARIEIVGDGFYPIDELPEDATPATRARLAEVLTGAPRSDLW
jgi:ADP-ribose pyrophosphatase YjhB (NUDIX family)